MLDRSLLGAITLAAALWATTAPTWGWDDAKYPDLKGQWRAIGGPGRFDISKPAGRGQQAPLTAEYQALFEANLVDQAAAQQRAVENSQRAAELATDRYRSGIVSYIEVVDASRDTLQAERDNAQLAGQRLIAAVQLIKALGGGWTVGNLPSLPALRKG